MMIQATKACRHCHSRMPARAAVCPACGRRQASRLLQAFWIFGSFATLLLMLFAIGKAVQPMDREAQDYLAASDEWTGIRQQYGVDALGGRRVAELGLPPVRVGSWEVRCAKVTYDPGAADPDNPPFRRVLIVDGAPSLEPTVDVRGFNAAWRRANCGG